MDVFNITPDFGAKVSTKPETRVTKFGDGYEQRQADGMNVLRKTWDLTFSLRSDTEADAVTDFLENQIDPASGAHNAFEWTDINGNLGKYVCRSWDRVKVKFNLNTVTATFEEVFEP